MLLWSEDRLGTWGDRLPGSAREGIEESDGWGCDGTAFGLDGGEEAAAVGLEELQVGRDLCGAGAVGAGCGDEVEFDDSVWASFGPLEDDPGTDAAGEPHGARREWSADGLIGHADDSAACAEDGARA